MKAIIKVVSILALLLPASAMAVVIDFDSAAGSPNGYSEAGATFSYLGTGTNFFSNSPNNTRAITMSGGDNNGSMRADIAGGASSIAVDLGDFNADADRIFLEIYSAANVLLGSVTQDLASSFRGMVTLSLSAANIGYAIFGTTGDLGLGGLYADNFTYESASVPEPGTAALLGLGLLAGAYARKRQARS